jgi:hypothetical protein
VPINDFLKLRSYCPLPGTRGNVTCITSKGLLICLTGPEEAPIASQEVVNSLLEAGEGASQAVTGVTSHHATQPI